MAAKRDFLVMSVAILFFYLQFGASQSIPVLPNALPQPDVLSRSIHVNESTGPSASAWVSDPSGRGTHGLISSCVTTLISCAFTAVHVNILPESSKAQVFFVRLAWMAIAIIAPEVVLWCAFDQLRAARQLRDAVNQLGQRAVDGDVALQDAPATPCRCTDLSSDSINPWTNYLRAKRSDSFAVPSAGRPSKFEDWTLSQAFYAVSGGFAVDSSSFWTQSRITFTPAGILELAKLGILPSISAEDVEDKSKADSIAKIAVVLQIGWFFMQSVARLASGLPLTLLEIHTLTHVACTLVVYAFWFPKPFNVPRPTLCVDERVIDLAALFALDRGQYFGGVDAYACCQTDEITVQNLKAARIQSIAPAKVLPLLTRANRAVDRLRYLGSHFEWSLTSDKAMGYRKCYAVYARKNHKIEGKTHEADTVRIPSPEKLPIINGYWVLPLITGCYGGVHLCAWTAHFPTVVEMWAWRAAGFAVVLTTILHFVWMISIELVIARYFDFTKEMGLIRKICASIVSAVGYTAEFLSVWMLMLYPVARLYFVVESVVSLRAPPVGTWETVEWTGFVPHIS